MQHARQQQLGSRRCPRCTRACCCSSTSAAHQHVCLCWNKYTQILLYFFKCALFKRLYPSRRVDSSTRHCPAYKYTRRKKPAFLCFAWVSPNSRGEGTRVFKVPPTPGLGFRASCKPVRPTAHPQHSCLNPSSPAAEHTHAPAPLAALGPCGTHRSDVHLNLRVLNRRARSGGGQRGAQVKLQSEKSILLKQNRSVIFKHFQKKGWLLFFISHSYEKLRVSCRNPSDHSWPLSPPL